jgi:hypothetical protein
MGVYCSLSAQVIDFGLNLGASFYSGDLSSSDLRQMIQENRPAVGAFVRLVHNRQLSTRFNFNHMSVQADDARTTRQDRGLSFRTDIWEFNTIFEWHAIRIRHTEYSFTFPYVFGGAGVYRFNPKTQVDGEWIELQPLGTEGQGLPGYEPPYNRTQFNLPFGAGIKFVHRQFTFGFEAGGRRLFTDYLDDVSGTTVNHREVFEGNGALAARLSNPQLGGAEGINRNYRRGSEPRDWYYMMNITLSYNFGQAIYKALQDPLPCPKFRSPTRRVY